MSITKNRASFHLWRKENLVKHQKVSKYYKNDCRYQIVLKTSLRGSDFIFDCVHLLYYKCHKMKQGGSYIVSPDWILNKKSTINPISKKDNKYFRYATTVALNYEEIGKYTGGITKIKPFIDNYNWEGINYPSEKDDWKKFERNNLTIALNVLRSKKEKIYRAYVSKHNSNCEKQVILLMILNGKGWDYAAVKKYLYY